MDAEKEKDFNAIVGRARALCRGDGMRLTAGFAVDAADEIARLRAELEAARADAERYRHARKRVSSGDEDIVIYRVVWKPNGLAERSILTEENADAAIDAARGRDNG